MFFISRSQYNLKKYIYVVFAVFGSLSSFIKDRPLEEGNLHLYINSSLTLQISTYICNNLDCLFNMYFHLFCHLPCRCFHQRTWISWAILTRTLNLWMMMKFLKWVLCTFDFRLSLNNYVCLFHCHHLFLL